MKKVYDVKQVNCHMSEFENTDFWQDPEITFQVFVLDYLEYKKFFEDDEENALKNIFVYIVDAWTGILDEQNNPEECNEKNKIKFVENFPDLAAMVVNQSQYFATERETI